MAIYKATYCYPLLNSLDVRIVADSADVNAVSPYQLLKCKVDSSNKTVTGYQIRLLDGANNQVFPVTNDGKGFISPLSELSAIAPDNLINSGLNGTMIHVPFFQNYNYDDDDPALNNMAIPSYNAIYYVPRYGADYVVGTADEPLTGWQLDGSGLILSKNEWDGSVNGEIAQEGEKILFLSTDNRGGIWVVQDDGTLSRYKDHAGEAVTNIKLAGFNVVIKKGSHHDEIWHYTNSTTYGVVSNHLGQWIDIEGNPIDLDIDGGTYKWEITLYQGEVATSYSVVTLDVGNLSYNVNVYYKNYAALSFDWYDAVLNRGTILGSTNKRIQIADALDDGQIPMGDSVSPLVLQGRYVQLLDQNGRQIADRSYVRSYDATYGHVYPMADAFQLNWIDQAEKVSFYKHSNNEEQVLANERVRLATTQNINLYQESYKDLENQQSSEDAADVGKCLYCLQNDYTDPDGYQFVNASPADVASHTYGSTRTIGNIGRNPTLTVPTAHNPYQFAFSFYCYEGFPSTLTAADATIVCESSSYQITDKTLTLSEGNSIITLSFKLAVHTSTLNVPTHITINAGSITWKYYKKVIGNYNPNLGLISIDGYQTKDNDVILVKNQVKAQENGVYRAHEGSWQRDGSFKDWGSFIGKILFVQEGLDNGGTNWESLALTGGSLMNVESATSGDSPLYFKIESPILLFGNKVKCGVQLVGDLHPSGSPTLTSDVVEVDGIPLAVGYQVYDYVLNKVYSIDSVSATSVQVSEQPYVINVNDFISVENGQTYGSSVIKITTIGSAPDISTELSEAFVLKNGVDHTYISPFVGAQPGMAIKLLNNKYVQLYSDDSLTKWLRIEEIDTTLWKVKHRRLTTPMKSADLTDNSIPFTYELRSYFKASDENPFYINEDPYLKIIGSFNPEVDWCPNMYSSEMIEFLNSLSGATRIIQAQALWVGGDDPGSGTARSLQDRIVELACSYHQAQQTSWESYRWMLLNYNAEVLQDTGTKYDKELKATFYGLSNEITDNPHGNVYYAVLTVKDELDITLTFIIQLVIDPASTVNAGITFTAEFDCSTQSILLNYQDVVYLYPNVDDPLSLKSYRYDVYNKDNYHGITWDNSYSISNEWLYTKDVGNAYTVPVMDITKSKTADPEGYSGLSQSVIRGINYTHYFLAGKESAPLNEQYLFVNEDQFYFETEIKLNTNYCGEFVRVQIEGDDGDRSYLSIALRLPENFINNIPKPTFYNTHRNEITALLEGYDGSSLEVKQKSTTLYKNASLPITWCSTGLSSKFILQPVNTEDNNSEYHAFSKLDAVHETDYYLWYKPVRNADGTVRYYLNSKRPLGNMCLFESSGGNAPAYWSENRGTLFFYANTDSDIDGLQAGEGINLVKINENIDCSDPATNNPNNIPVWPEDVDGDGFIWDESGIDANNCPSTWNAVTDGNPGMSRWYPMNRHPDSALATDTWRVIIKLESTDDIYFDLIHNNGSHLSFEGDNDAPNTTYIKYNNVVYGSIVFKKVS